MHIIISLRILSVNVLLRIFSTIYGDMKIFAERLRELRTEKGLSMKQLAKALNVTDAAISNWENDINEPKITYLKVICLYFGVSADYLLGFED